jgi:hypothetical protein
MAKGERNHKMTPTEVRHKLDNIGYYKPFTVVFTKANGEQRKITGYMEQPTSGPKQSKAVPIVTEEGWKSFRLDSVLGIIT